MNYDNITLQRIQTLHPSVRKEVDEIYKEICTKLTGKAEVRFTYTLRTEAEQKALYAQGRESLIEVNSLRKAANMGPITESQNKIVTKAKEWQSIHNFGLAIDIVLLIDNKEISYDMNKDFDNDGKADWMEVVEIFKKHNWVWGGDWKSFKDTPHFEKTFGLTVSQLNEKRIKKEFIPNTTYVKI
jgi:peptidoglycan L-alanyl-D-glutamate endopeptidase CwlK